MAAQVVAGVDVGTSSVRAVAIDREGQVVAASKAAYASSSRPAVGEADPAMWLDGLGDAMLSLRCAAPRALGVGGQGPTTVAAGGELGLTYRHPAGASADFAGQQRAQAALLRKRLGSGTRPRQMWDYLLSRLGGREDIQSVWPGTEPIQGFGDPVPVGSPIGITTGSHGFPEGVVLAPGSNDAHLTAWAGAIDTPGRGFDPGGRSGGLGVAVSSRDHRSAAEHGMPSHVSGVYIVGGPVASHGAMLDWWADVTGRPVADLVDAASAVEPGSGGVLVLPFLEGERAPRWEPRLRAEIIGLGRDSGVGVVARAILESTAYGLAHIALDLAARGFELHRVVSSGGPSRSKLWTAIKAAVLGVPVDVPACDEMAAYGAALGAGAAVGWWPGPRNGMPGEWPTPPVATFDPEYIPAYEQGLQRFIALGDQATSRLGRGHVRYASGRQEESS